MPHPSPGSLRRAARAALPAAVLAATALRGGAALAQEPVVDGGAPEWIGARVDGWLSPYDDAPRRGVLVLQSDGLRFHEHGTRVVRTLPLWREVRLLADEAVMVRVGTVRADHESADGMAMFRFQGATFQTEAPARLIELVYDTDIDSLPRQAERRRVRESDDMAGKREIVERLAVSMALDSLRAVFRPDSSLVLRAGRTVPFTGAQGGFRADSQIVELFPESHEYESDVEATVRHEMIHAWQFGPDSATARALRDSVQRPLVREAYGWEHNPRQRHELQAQEMAHAWRFLQLTAKLAPDDAEGAALRSAIVRVYPGVPHAVRWLLAQPLWQGHPLAPVGLPGTGLAVPPDPVSGRQRRR